MNLWKNLWNKKYLSALIIILASNIYSKNAQVNFYNDGIGQFFLKPIPETVDYKLHLTGNSKYNNLLLYIKKGNNTRKFAFTLKKTNFNFYYLLKDGKGSYNISIYGTKHKSLQYKGLCYFEITAKTNIPKNLKELYINDKITNFVHSMIGKKVGRGECWDLAQEALDRAYADWNRPTDYGILLTPEKDKILPGDIIQIRSMVLKYSNKIEYLGTPDHTAIVDKVIDKNIYQIYHQNVGGKKYVIKGFLNLNYKKSGKIYFYRPQAGLIPVKLK